MFKFVDLCVVERASKEAREGLNEYKKLTEKVCGLGGHSGGS